MPNVSIKWFYFFFFLGNNGMFVTAGLATQIRVWSIVVYKLISTAHSHKDLYYNITIVNNIYSRG